jgi:hypothetical protein
MAFSVVQFSGPQPITIDDGNGVNPVKAYGLAAPAVALLIGAKQGSNMEALTMASGRLLVDGSGVTQPVSGTFWQATQPVSIAATVAVSGPLTDAQLRATAVPVSGTFWQATQPVSGTVTANIGTTNGIALDATLTGGTQQSRITDGTNIATVKAASTAAAAADKALVVAISPNNTVAVTGTFFQATQPVSIAATVAVSGPLTDIQLRATPVPVSGTVTANLGTIAGMATETTLAAMLTLAGFQARINTMGQKTMANGTPVTLASDQSAIPASQSGTWTVQQGATPTGIANAWSVKVTDGTNLQAMMDVASRAGFVRPTDGTNNMPMGDANARAIWHQIGDGTTGPVAIKAASTAPVATDKALVVVLSPNQGTLSVTTAVPNSTPSLAFGDIALAAITTAAIRRTTYTEQTINFTGSISSSSASDAAAGTGARTVRIYYVDQTGATAGTEDVTLNGTSWVNLVTTTKCFIEKIEVLTVGSTGSNVGIITLKTGSAGAGTTVGTIAATDNRTFWAHHYVITGQTCNITGVLIGSNVTNTSGSCVGFLRGQSLSVANAVEKQISDFVIVAGLDSAVYRSYGSQIKIAGPARVTMYVTTATGSAFTYRGSFDAYDA